jgi:inosine-uridine nucleoside N-ribohydrolase
MSKHKIIIDTDPGIDDAMAIHFAFAHPDIEVLGLTTVFGNVHTHTATRNALALVEMAAYTAAAVAHGADSPLVVPLNPPAHYAHGAEGFGDVPAAHPKVELGSRPAATFICDAINQNPGEVTLCAVSPLTNLALALRHDPQIVERVCKIVIMGGAVDTRGNVSEWAEANIWSDPHAADEVFAAQWPITLVGLDVTEKVHCTPEDFGSLAASSPVIGGFLNEATQFYFDFHRQRHDLDGCFLHDPSAVIAITDPDMFAKEGACLRVVCEGGRVGQIVRCTSETRRAVEVCLGVDRARVRGLFLSTLKNADTAMAERKGTRRG